MFVKFKCCTSKKYENQQRSGCTIECQSLDRTEPHHSHLIAQYATNVIPQCHVENETEIALERAVAVGVAVDKKLAHAANVALGATVDDTVLLDP